MIQWRKFGLKRSSTFNYEFLSLCPFFIYNLIFKLIFIKFFLFKIAKRGFTYPQVMTWREGPPSRYDAALGPRAMAAGSPREA